MKKLNGKDIELEVISLKESIAEIRSTLDGLKGVKCGERVQGGLTDTDGGLTNKIEWLRQQEEKLNKLIDKQIEIMQAIDNIPNPRARAIYRYRYVNGHSYERIAIAMNMSRTQVYRLHDRYFKYYKK